MANTRVNALATQGYSAATDDFYDEDGTVNGSRKISPHDAHGQFRNALAPRGGVAFDGTTSPNTKLTTVAGAAMAINTDARSLCWGMQVPATAPSSSQVLAIIGASASATDSYIRVVLTNGGALAVRIYGATSSDYRETTFAGIVTSFGGKEIHCVFAADSSGRNLYINGLARTLTADTTGGSPPANWQGAIAVSTGVMSFWGDLAWLLHYGHVWNMVIDSAIAIEVYESGGLVPDRFKFGSQTARYTSDFSAGLNGWGGTDNSVTLTGNIDADADGAGIPPSNDWLRALNPHLWAQMYCSIPNLTFGKMYQSTAQIFTPASYTGPGYISASYMVNGPVYGSVALVPGSTVSLACSTFKALASRFMLGTATTLNGAPGNSNNANFDQVFYLKSVVHRQVGAVAYLPLDDGLGYQLQDVSTNRLHALMTTTGVSHIAPLYGPGRVRYLTDGTTVAQKLCGGTTLPALCQILRIRARAQSGTPNIILGSSSGGTQIVASVALSTTWKDLTIALTGGIVTAATDLWTTISTANAVEIDITWEPLSP